jgi:hypothetical protein
LAQRCDLSALFSAQNKKTAKILGSLLFFGLTYFSSLLSITSGTSYTLDITRIVRVVPPLHPLITPSLAFRGVRAFPTLTPYALLGAMLTVIHDK